MLFLQTLLAVTILALSNAQSQTQNIAFLDRFAIFEQMSLHQTLIDTDQTCANARAYASLYWPEGNLRVIDPNRDSTVTG